MHFNIFNHGHEDDAALAVRPTVDSIIVCWKNSGGGSIARIQEVVEDSNLISGAVHRRVVVAFQSKKYLSLAAHLQIAINLAFTRLKQGRLVQKVAHGDQTIFLMTVLPAANRVGTIYDEATLNEAFEVAGGVGRVTIDHYEIKLALRLINDFGATE